MSQKDMDHGIDQHDLERNKELCDILGEEIWICDAESAMYGPKFMRTTKLLSTAMENDLVQRN